MMWFAHLKEHTFLLKETNCTSSPENTTYPEPEANAAPVTGHPCHSETKADSGIEERGFQHSQTVISVEVSNGEWQISDARRVSFLRAV